MKKNISFFLKLIAGTIMLQTLIFKFSGAAESIDLFTTIAGEHEAMVRIGTGFLECVASILLFIPKKTWLGALLTIGLMGGALWSHITILGIVHNNDSGALFFGAAVTFLAGSSLLLLHKKDIPHS